MNGGDFRSYVSVRNLRQLVFREEETSGLQLLRNEHMGITFIIYCMKRQHRDGEMQTVTQTATNANTTSTLWKRLHRE